MNVLIVGSSLIDLFISLDHDESASYSENTVTFKLGDKVPIDINTFALGGNGANITVGMKKLGINTQFYTYLGNDILSKHIESQITEFGIPIAYDPERSPGTSLSLIFDFPQDRVIFSHHQIKHHGFDPELITKPDHIYLNSIGEEWEEAYEKVLSYAKQHGIPLAFSPGSAQMHEINETFIEALHTCTFLFINREEAETILKATQKEYTDIKSILSQLKTFNIKTVSVTDGGNGAYAMDEQGVFYQSMPFGPAGPEKTGAGDSYAAGFFAAYLEGKGVKEAMRWGLINSYHVMQTAGAQNGILNREEMEKISSERSDFQPIVE